MVVGLRKDIKVEYTFSSIPKKLAKVTGYNIIDKETSNVLGWCNNLFLLTHLSNFSPEEVYYQPYLPLIVGIHEIWDKEDIKKLPSNIYMESN